jgi:hypothetical protein
MTPVNLERSNIAKATAVGVVSGLGLSSLVLRNVALHSKSVLVNFYTNGTMDFSVDVTSLAKSAIALAFAVFLVGLVLGLLMVKVHMRADPPILADNEPIVIGVLETVSNSSDPQATWSDIAGDDRLEEYARVLSKSGLLRGVVTEGKMSYELTETGLRFLEEYKEIARGPKQKASAPQQTASLKTN